MFAVINEFFSKLWRGEFERRQAWGIAEYITILVVVSPYILIVAAFLGGAWYAYTVI